jgi:hypothetical protein
MGDSPVVPYTGLDSDMAHDQRMLAEIDRQVASGVPVGEARASAPLRMPGQFDAIFDGVNKMRQGKPAADFNEETLRNLDKVYEQLETQPPASAVVVNFHPLVLRVNGGRNYYQSVPPCTPDMCTREPGKQCTSLLIAEAAIDPVPQESGNHTFDALFPLWLAQNYMNVANANVQLWGPGAFIYEGELSLEEMWREDVKIKTFTDLGMPLFTEVAGNFTSRRAGGIVPGKKRVPVMRSYRDVYMEMFERRNKAYFEIVTKMDSEYHQATGKDRKNVGINGMTRDQAQVCLNLGLLLKAPEWLTPTRLDSGVAAEKCGNCRSDVLDKAVMCQHCGWPIDAYTAFMDSKIDVEHLALLDLPEDKLTEVYRTDYERKDKVKQARQKAGELRRKEGAEAARNKSGS